MLVDPNTGMPGAMDLWEKLDPELQEQLRCASSDAERVDIANEYAWTQRHSRPREALNAALYAESLLEELNDDCRRAHCLRNRAALFFFTGDAEQALQAARTALAWFESHDETRWVIPTLLVLGGISMRLAQWDKAYDYYSRAQQLCEQLLQNDPHNQLAQRNWAAALSNIGSVYAALGQFEQGLRRLLQAYRHQVELEDKRGLGITAIGIAGVYVQLGRFQEAEAFLRQACELLRETETTYMLALALSNLGHLMALQRRWEEAQRYQEEALALYKGMGNELGEAATLSTLAMLYFHQGKTLDAFYELRQILQKFQHLRDVNLAIKLRRELGDVLIAMKDFQVGLQHYHIGMQLARQHGMLFWEMEFTRLCARIFEEQGVLDKALDYYKRYWALYERFLGQRRQQAITVLEKELEMERLRYERELYRLRNEELATALAEVDRQRAEVERAYSEYQRAMEERFTLLSVLSHELRNLVGGIMTNADLILKGLNRLEPSVILETADYILRASEHLRDELQLLSRWQTLEMKGVQHYYQVDDLRELVRRIVAYQHREISYKDIQVIVDSEEDPFRVPMDWTHTQEILTNYLLNAIKYSPKGARVWIRLRRTADGGARIAVEDEGVGIPPSELPKLFKKLGRAENVHPTLGEPSVGLGLYIVKWLADRMRCRVWCESCRGKGSIFYLQIPFRRGEGPYFVGDPEPEEWQHLRAEAPTLEEGEQGYRPRPGWVAYFPDEDRLVYSPEALAATGEPPPEERESADMA